MYKNILVIFFNILALSRIKCEDTTKKLLVNEQQNNDTTNSNYLNNNNFVVYIENVIISLKNQLWLDEERKCLEHTLLMMDSVQNSTFWAVWSELYFYLFE